jgi:hypothetical protein
LKNLGGSGSGNHLCDSSLGFLNGDPLSASETNVVVFRSDLVGQAAGAALIVVG